MLKQQDRTLNFGFDRNLCSPEFGRSDSHSRERVEKLRKTTLMRPFLASRDA